MPPMSRHPAFEPDRPSSTPQLGAIEITSFDGLAANDNGDAGRRPMPRRKAGIGLPVVAFVSGVGAASIVAFASQMLGLGG